MIGIKAIKNDLTTVFVNKKVKINTEVIVLRAKTNAR